MLASLLLILSAAIVLINTVICSLSICTFAILKLIIPIQALRNRFTEICNGLMWFWGTFNHRILNTFNTIEWDIEGGEDLKMKDWYLVLCNHMSWADIVILTGILKDRIPMPKFFLKQQLLYIPFIGIACWGLDMPFMKRYSRQYLLKHPEKRGKDIEATRESCRKFINTPTTVVNFTEGTRFTAEKHKQLKSPYQNLLPPKTGALYYTLATMGQQLSTLVNITMCYPENEASPFKDMLKGRMTKVIIRIETSAIKDELSPTLLSENPPKKELQEWLSNKWQQKDALISALKNSSQHTK